MQPCRVVKFRIPAGVLKYCRIKNRTRVRRTRFIICAALANIGQSLEVSVSKEILNEQ